MKLKDLVKYSKTVKILYVEDNKEARESTLLLLEELFDNIVVAEDGEDGYNKFITNKDNLDLIITDLNMPKLNGIDMIDKIRDTGSLIPVIVFSAYEDKDNYINSVKLNISYYLNKPINIKKFEPVIKKTVKKIIIKAINDEFDQ